MSKKLHSITVRGRTKVWSFNTYVDPKYVDEWREDGLEVDKILNTIPEGVVNMGLLRPWIFFQDLMNFKNPFGGRRKAQEEEPKIDADIEGPHEPQPPTQEHEMINSMQALFDAMGDAERKTRSEYHLTLDALLGMLTIFCDEGDQLTTVVFDAGGAPFFPHSYRGYYSDLAFDITEEDTTAQQLLTHCEESLGTTFVGWKGGDFIMGGDTPLWMSEEGHTGRAIMGVEKRVGKIALITKQID